MPLIPSGRHTPADLDLWADLEEADHANARRPVLARKVAQSIAAIEAFVAGGACYAATSWGKDSVVLCHLLWRVAPHVPLTHLRPTNHNPECDQVRDTFLARWPFPAYTEIAVDYRGIDRGLPDEIVDRLTDREWYAAIARCEARYGDRKILGLRADESAGRRIRCHIWGHSSPRSCAPLAWWTTTDVFAYLAAHELPVHPVYAMLGSGRWDRERLRVAEIGDTHGKGGGRRDWEREYYGDTLNRLESATPD